MTSIRCRRYLSALFRPRAPSAAASLVAGTAIAVVFIGAARSFLGAAPDARRRGRRRPAAPEQMHDYWSFRPTKQAPETPPPRRAQPAPAGNERESDLEAVQGMIKRLADELSVGGEAGSTAPEQSTEKAIHASVNALHTTAETMRASASKAPPAAGSQRERTAPPSMPPPIAAGHTRLSSVAAAISAGRMDVLMRSIIGLADHKVHHYELVVSPRDEKGAVVPLAVHDPNLAQDGPASAARQRQAYPREPRVPLARRGAAEAVRVHAR